MNKKSFINKFFFNFFIITIVTLSLLLISMKFFEKKFSNEIIKIEVNHGYSVSKKVKKIIESNKFKNKNELLNLLLTNDIKYIYVIKKIKGKLKYIYDGSPIQERAIKYQPFEPVNKNLWKKVFILKKPVFSLNKKIDGIWMTYLFPVKNNNNKIKYIIAMDISLNAINKFDVLLYTFKKIMFFILGIFLLLSIIIGHILYKMYQEKIASFIDPLTQTYNRKILSLIENENLKDSAVIMFDIDNFKKINDTYGHEAGDIVLKNLSDIIKSSIREYDYLIRYGGEEFVLILRRIKKIDAIKRIEEIFKKIRNTKIYLNKNKYINITVSAGIHLAPNKEKSLYEAIKKADEELYNAKRTGKNKYLIYSEKKDNKIFDINEIIKAIEEKNLTIYLQPIIDTQTQKIVKFEALARVYFNNKVYTPNHFIDHIKKTNIYRDFTSYIIDLVFEIIIQYKINININFFAEDFLDEKFLLMLEEKNSKYKNYLQYLTIELLENEPINDLNKIKNIIEKLQQKDIQIALDDFGSGFNNLNYLVYIKPDYIKIDSSIVKNIKHNINALEIVKIINNLSQKLNIKTIAEFVEDKDSYEILKKLNINYIQGFYFYKPIEKEKIKDYLKILISA